MMNLFAYGHKKKIAQIASECVGQARLEKYKRMTEAKSYLVGSQSPVTQRIYQHAKSGLLGTTIDFAELNENGDINDLQRFDDKELDELIYHVTLFLLDEGCNVCVKLQTLIITWPDPLNNPQDERQITTEIQTVPN